MSRDDVNALWPRLRPSLLSRLILAAIAIAILIALAACGGGDDAGSTTSDDAASSTATVSAPPLNAATSASLGEPGREVGVLDDHRPEIGERAPDFALRNARDPDRVVRLSDFRGTPIVLNWFASWCGPCRAEIPDLQAAAAALEGKVLFLGVNLQERPSTAVAMLTGLGAAYPAILDEDGAIAAHYRLLGMPTTYFIDAEGVVVSRGAGLITAEALAAELGKLGFSYTPPTRER